MSRLTEEQLRALDERFARERVAAGLPEYICDESFHRLVGHILATHKARTTNAAPGGGGRRSLNRSDRATERNREQPT